MDVEGRTVPATAAAEQTFGWMKEELSGKVLHDVVHHHYPDGRPFPMSECPLGHVFEIHRLVKKHEDVFFHRNGTPVHVACSNAPVMLNSEMVGAVLIAVDITEPKRAEEHQRLLMHELNHRVKNTLATVQALVTQTLRTSPSTSEAKAAIDARLTALSCAHDVLTRERWDGADLHEIAARAVEPFALPGFTLQVPMFGLLPTRFLQWPWRCRSLRRTRRSMDPSPIPQDKSFCLGGSRARQAFHAFISPGRRKGGPPVVPPSRRGFGHV
ncbi:hypothetical protein DC522_22180 [Microvirga sp. KLBC 81]|uniref:HWE histidine kinase domain-containing protein n=1 Tax=Microvirga sp. KLBC 81 TaxID=1862707 RepID=UPI000D50846E|nr:HWE histidine kinase domain-containing protein [Microvirga sp. KLBC 81]PVE22210.1 hypothetical protein DC522_22180 [Microvirga sp. KLBC 81]